MKNDQTPNFAYKTAIMCYTINEVMPLVTYEVTEEKTNRVSYGLSARDDKGNAITIHDVFTVHSEAQRFVSLLNEEQLELVHLEQVISDYLQYFTL